MNSCHPRALKAEKPPFIWCWAVDITVRAVQDVAACGFCISDAQHVLPACTAWLSAAIYCHYVANTMATSHEQLVVTNLGGWACAWTTGPQQICCRYDSCVGYTSNASLIPGYLTRFPEPSAYTGTVDHEDK